MKMKTIKKIIIPVVALLMANDLYAQEAMSLDQCVAYALENHANIKNAVLDNEIAESKVKETISIGLPQINGEAQLIDNLEVQTQFLPADAFFIPGLGFPPPEEGAVSETAFGVQYSGIASATLSQLIFDGSYFVGLKAAKAYKELSQTSINQSKIDVVENVNKAFYLVLINRERIKLLNNNKAQLETLLEDSRVLVENGFMEQVDLQRTEVSLNNLSVNINKMKNAEAISIALLKFQMGMPQRDSISIDANFETLNDELLEVSEGDDVNYENRIEYKLLNQQLTLRKLDVKNEKVQYLPKLSAFGTLGANNGAVEAGELVDFGDWQSYSLIGLNLQLPIFSSFRRKHRIAQSQATYNQVENQIDLLENSIEFEYLQSKLTYKDQVNAIETQKKTLELAENVYRVTKIKYDEGIASNFEIIETETALQEAQTNYFEALYNALIAKIELQKSNGTLYQF